LMVKVNELQTKTQQPQFSLNLKRSSKSQEEFERLATEVDETVSEVDDLRKGLNADKALWRTVQATIASVTESYSTTHSLNTVVSDLMSLTNAILDQQIEGDRPRGRSNPQLVHHAVMTLVKMMAPITPAVADYAWEKLSLRTAHPIKYYINEAGSKVLNLTVAPFKAPGSQYANLTTLHDPGSIFDQPFPTTDATYEMLAPATQKCAVQINGKLRIAVEVSKPPPDLTEKERKDWLVKEILQTKDGKEKLMGVPKNGRPTIDIRKAKRAIVVKGGKTVNFIV